MILIYFSFHFWEKISIDLQYTSIEILLRWVLHHDKTLRFQILFFLSCVLSFIMDNYFCGFFYQVYFCFVLILSFRFSNINIWKLVISIHSHFLQWVLYCDKNLWFQWTFQLSCVSSFLLDNCFFFFIVLFLNYLFSLNILIYLPGGF